MSRRDYAAERHARLVGTHAASELRARSEIGVAIRNGEPIHVRTLGDLKADGESGNGGEAWVGGTKHAPRCTCWCERRVLDVTWEEVAEGVTRSCGSARCDALEQAEMTGGLR